MRKLLPLSLLALAPAVAGQDPAPLPQPMPGCATPRWTQDAWPERRAQIAEDKAAEVAALEAWAFPSTSPEDDAARKGVRTEGLLVIQGGEILYERYGRGFDEGKRHLGWSMSKSFINTLVGIGVHKGLLSVTDSICEHVTVANPENCAIRVQDLLEFSSGLDWRETYEGDSPTGSTVVAMLYGDGREDMAAFIGAQPRRAAPGELWQYSSGDTTLLAAVVGAALKPEFGEAFAWEALFEPLGMASATFEHDPAGTLTGSSSLYATPRDFGRWGLLWLDDGCWMGERLLPPGWVQTSTQVAPSLRKGAVDREPGDTNGWQIWLNQAVPELGDTQRPWPDAPPDTYAAMGHWKQAVIVIPSADMVIVRTGDDRDGSYSWNTLMKLSLALGSPGDPVEVPPYTPGPPAQIIASLPREYNTSLLHLGGAYGARLACACWCVEEQTADYCRAWIKASPDIVKVKVDTEEKRVTAVALGLVRERARWLGEREGCILE